MRAGIVVVVFLWAASAADAQCPNCGGFHGGAPGVEQVKENVAKAEAQGKALMDLYREKQAVAQAEYQARANQVIEQERQRQAEALRAKAEYVPDPSHAKVLEAIQQAKMQELLFSHALQPMELAKAAAAEGKPEDPALKASTSAALGAVMGTEAARLRVRLSASLERLDPAKAVGKARDEIKSEIESRWKKGTGVIEDSRRQLNELLGKDVPEDEDE
jgi:hypothetical protein